MHRVLKTSFLTKVVLYQQYHYIFKGILSDVIEDIDIWKLPTVGFLQRTGLASTRVTMDAANLVYLLVKRGIK
jgi:hypothetical protein